ncbi:MAG: tryptophan--tRNA ligase [Actinomycetes bacterium]
MRILSGIQPTGTPHLGNYLGAIRNWVANQNEESLYCVVDLHSLTGEIDPAVLNANTRQLFAALLASGLDQNRCTLFIQSQVPWHSQLNWLLECVASYGELKRMTQFKEKAERQGAYRVGLLTYPVLMAADILLYQTTHVPVGDDQRQHLELARELAERFNHRYGDTFVVPEGMVPQFGARVMDLQEPTRKMSKSVSSPQGSIDLFDSESEITKKIKRAVTDTDNEVRYDWDHKPGLSNLLEIFGAVTYRTPAEVAASYERYGDLKTDLAEALIAALSPIRARYEELLRDPAELSRMAKVGAEKAEPLAAVTYQRAAAAMGLLA